MIKKILKLLPLLVATTFVVWPFVDLKNHLGEVYGDPQRVVQWVDVIGVPLSFIAIMGVGVLAYKSLEEE